LIKMCVQQKKHTHRAKTKNHAHVISRYETSPETIPHNRCLPNGSDPDCGNKRTAQRPNAGARRRARQSPGPKALETKARDGIALLNSRRHLRMSMARRATCALCCNCHGELQCGSRQRIAEQPTERQRNESPVARHIIAGAEVTSLTHLHLARPGAQRGLALASCALRKIACRPRERCRQARRALLRPAPGSPARGRSHKS